ncbi:hypothetical protein ACFVUS_00995 [Nocardia sp. NPDC058058]|uniref:hypothetical protein n=1 Tax=Nocardia sp. NPDC058058 TaxID=3346317 RepID=UPI0036DD7CBF
MKRFLPGAPVVRVADLRRLDPMGRQRALEAAASQLLALVTLPFTHPGVPRPPEWTQLLGLTFLLASCVITLHTWRSIVGYAGRAGGRADLRLREQARNERRLRRAALIYPIVTLVLLPLPPTWRWLWFTLTVVSAVLGAIALYRLPRSLPPAG